MKLVVRVFKEYKEIEEYIYTDMGFLFNGRAIDASNRVSKLLYLFSMTKDWDKASCSYQVKEGVYVSFEVEGVNNEYIFSKSFPYNFMIFISEVKRMSEE